jgi:hypothetical protein
LPWQAAVVQDKFHVWPSVAGFAEGELAMLLAKAGVP